MSKTFHKNRPNTYGRVQPEYLERERLQRQKHSVEPRLQFVPEQAVNDLHKYPKFRKMTRENLERAAGEILKKLGLPQNETLEKYLPVVIAMIMISMAAGSVIQPDEAFAKIDAGADTDNDDAENKKTESEGGNNDNEGKKNEDPSAPVPAQTSKCPAPGMEEYLKFKSEEIDQLLAGGEDGPCKASELIKRCAEMDGIRKVLSDSDPSDSHIDCSTEELESEFNKELEARYERYMKAGVSEEQLKKFWQYDRYRGSESSHSNYFFDKESDFIGLVEQLKALGVNMDDGSILNALLTRTKVENQVIDYDIRAEVTTMLLKGLSALQKAGVTIDQRVVWGLYSAEKNYLDPIIALEKSRVQPTFEMLHYLSANDLKKMAEEVGKKLAEDNKEKTPQQKSDIIHSIGTEYYDKAEMLHELAKSISQYGDNRDPNEMADPRAEQPGFNLPAAQETCLPGRLLHVRDIGDNVWKISQECGITGEVLHEVVKAAEPRYLKNAEYVAAIIKEYKKQKAEYDESQKSATEAEKKPFDSNPVTSWISGELTPKVQPLLDAIDPPDAVEKAYKIEEIQMEAIKEGENLWDVMDRSVKKNNPLEEAPKIDEEIWEEIKSKLEVKAYYPGDKLGIVEDKKNCQYIVKFYSKKLNKEIEIKVKY